MKCKNCNQQFIITPQDKIFYQKLNVPEPNLCVECRSQRRSAFRNEKSLYERQCDLCKKNIISVCSKDKPYPVYCQDCYWSDKWDQLGHSVELDLEKSFFEQFNQLLKKTPRLAIMNKQSENSDYCNYSFANKNCYLTFGNHYEENCMYSRYSTKNKDCVDCQQLYGSELCYECIFSGNCYNCVYLDHCHNCYGCYFSKDLKGCKNCLFCANLRNKQYYILNKQYTKQEYNQKVETYQLANKLGFEKAVNFYLQEFKNKFVQRASYKVNCENCQGNNLKNSKNLTHCFDATNCESCTYGFQMDETYNSMDINYMGYDRSELCYQTIGCTGLYNCLACDSCWHGNDLYYCNLCFSSKNCFGCVSLNKQKYCILNKQYSEPEYKQTVAKIIDKMKQDNEWGDFFPMEISPFKYKETVASEYYPRKNEPINNEGATTTSHLPTCSKCHKNYKIIDQEKEFYKTQNLPEPQVCPQCRHQARNNRAGQRSLFKRVCIKCNKEVITPHKTKGTLCEACYKKSIY